MTETATETGPRQATPESRETGPGADPVGWAVQGVLALYLVPAVVVAVAVGGLALAVGLVFRASRALIRPA